MNTAIPVYKEKRPNKLFLDYVRRWLKTKKIKPECLLVSRSNLIAAVIPGLSGPSLICFYTANLHCVSVSGVVIYYDLEALHVTMKSKIEHTFSNWLAQSHLHNI